MRWSILNWKNASGGLKTLAAGSAWWSIQRFHITAVWVSVSVITHTSQEIPQTPVQTAIFQSRDSLWILVDPGPSHLRYHLHCDLERWEGSWVMGQPWQVTYGKIGHQLSCQLQHLGRQMRSNGRIASENYASFHRAKIWRIGRLQYDNEARWHRIDGPKKQKLIVSLPPYRRCNRESLVES